MDLLKMKEMMAKKKKDEGMSDMEKDAKMGVIKHMRDMASEGMGDKLKNLKKVTVASDSPEGLDMGLKKAREMMGQDPETGGDSREEQEESPEYEAAEPEPSSDEMEMSPEKDPLEAQYDDMEPDELNKHFEALMKAREKHQ